jgi:hypothetical protein
LIPAPAPPCEAHILEPAPCTLPPSSQTRCTVNLAAINRS